MSHTPGPWQWVKRENGLLMLIHPHSGWLVVMDFVRMGMNLAQPRFATWKGEHRQNMGGLMVNAKELDVYWHPDARLMAAAPCLLTALEAMVTATQNDNRGLYEARQLADAVLSRVRSGE